MLAAIFLDDHSGNLYYDNTTIFPEESFITNHEIIRISCSRLEKDVKRGLDFLVELFVEFRVTKQTPKIRSFIYYAT